MEENEIRHEENDIAEDRREEAESIADAEKEADTAEEKEAINDIAEDNREEGESLEDLKGALKNALYENSILKEKLARVEKERDDAHAMFLGSERTSETEKRDYNSLIGGIQ